MLEKKIEGDVGKYAKKRGVTPYKFNSPARAAVPDRMYIMKGVIYFIEFKAEGKKPTTSQIREHTKLRENGAVVFVIDNIPHGKMVVDLICLGINPQIVFDNCKTTVK